jgi:hypothetical protein
MTMVSMVSFACSQSSQNRNLLLKSSQKIEMEEANKISKEVTPWKGSKAKELLYKDIVEGRVTDEMPANVVYLMRPEYKDYDKQRFRTNFFNLLLSIRQKQEAAASNNAALMNDNRLR